MKKLKRHLFNCEIFFLHITIQQFWALQIIHFYPSIGVRFPALPTNEEGPTRIFFFVVHQTFDFKCVFFVIDIETSFFCRSKFYCWYFCTFWCLRSFQYATTVFLITFFMASLRIGFRFFIRISISTGWFLCR